MKKIVLIDDDKDHLMMLEELLKLEDYDVMAFDEGIDALDYVKHNKVDLLISDVVMANFDGLQLVQLLKAHNIDVPIILVTGRNDEKAELQALDLEVVDYIHKPFSNKVFLKRVAKIIAHKDTSVTSKYLYINSANIKFDIEKHYIYKDNELVELSSLETQILYYFMKNKNKVISREEILKYVWNTDKIEIETRVIDVYVMNLRKKLKLSNIQTIYGNGYCLND